MGELNEKLKDPMYSLRHELAAERLKVEDLQAEVEALTKTRDSANKRCETLKAERDAARAEVDNRLDTEHEDDDFQNNEDWLRRD